MTFEQQIFVLMLAITFFLFTKTPQPVRNNIHRAHR